jgi:hypothetical protein
MCIRRETREKARRSLAFSRVSKPHTHITHMLRQCTSIVYIIDSVYLSLSSVLWCPLQFRMKSMFNSSLTPNCLYAGWYLICVHDLTIWVPWWVSYTKQELLTLPEHLGSPPVFDVVRDANLLIFCVLLISFVCLCVLCAQCCACLCIVQY